MHSISKNKENLDSADSPTKANPVQIQNLYPDSRVMIWITSKTKLTETCLSKDTSVIKLAKRSDQF